MSEPQPQFLEVGSGAARRRIAYITESAMASSGLGLLWLIGLKSDMVSTKATALARWAKEKGLGLTRFDYSGHGQSEGRFEDGTVGAWLEEARAVFASVTRGPQIVIGSSTGAHIALLLLRALLQEDPASAKRIKGLVLIAPAWDLTEELMWKKFPEEARMEMREKGHYLLPSEYDPAGFTVITRAFIEDGRKHLLARQPFDPGRPVHVLQGLQDVDVPASHARELMSFLTGGWAEMTEVPDGEHRLSRPEDLALLFAIIERMAARASG